MIEALFAIGNVVETKGELEEFIDEIGSSDKYDYVYKITFDINDITNPIFRGIEFEEYSSDKKMKYFFKGGKGQKTDLTPTTRITEVDKTLKKFTRFFGDFISTNKDFLSREDIDFIVKIGNEIKANQEEIKNYLEEKVKSSKKSKAITLQFRQKDNTYYVGDMPVFIKPFTSSQESFLQYKDYYWKYGTQSKAKDKFCYVCGKKAKEVWGFANTYNFYTVDKRSFVTGGFNQSLAWKNYPVCPDCVVVLERAKRYVQENLNFSFCDFKYFLVPELVYSDKNILEMLLKKMKDYKNSILSEKSKTIVRAEEYILKKLSEENNVANFNFVFYEAKQSAFNILLYIQEVAPTRLKNIINAIDKVDDKDFSGIFDFEKIKNNEIDFSFRFNFIREFFPDNKFDGKFNKSFLEILNNIFIGHNIDADFLFTRFMQKIRQTFLNSNKPITLMILVLKSFKILLYLEEISILNRRRFNVDEPNELNQSYESFFKEYSIFDDSTKKALFLEGVLVQELLNIQYKYRGSTPFRKKLNGLKIDEKTAKKVFTEAINKLEEYEKNFFKKLEEAIAAYLIKSDFSKYSVDELSYYFTLGMALGKRIKEDKDNVEEKQ